jgi:hypothetical protein
MDDRGRSSPLETLLEYSSCRGVALRVDRERAVISGVKILGLESANGRSYSPRALAAARALYEGRPVNIDHVDGPRRSYRDRIGRLTAVTLGADGLYGDLHLNPKHPLAEQLLWDAEHAPENVGLSHDARGRTAIRDGRVIVEAIESVRSVDLVAEPATTKGLFESADAATLDPPADPSADPPADADESDVDDPDSLPDEAFALVLPGGVRWRDKTFPLHKRYFPIHTAAAVRRSLTRIAANQKLSAAHREAALQRAKDAARRFGIDPALFVKEAQMATDNLAQLTLAELKEARPDLVAQLQASSDLEREVAALKQERDQLAAELARFRRLEQLQRELAEAKLDWDQIPKSIQETLLEAEDQRRKALVEDLCRLQASRPLSPRSSRPSPVPATFEERTQSWIA